VTAASTDEWTARYLRLLGVERTTPDLQTLRRLTAAHLLNIPFENVSSILRRQANAAGPVPELDPSEVLERWERGTAGGVCFEIAGMLGWLLRALGYRAHNVLGFILFPGSHQALVAEIQGQSYLVDVGCGAPLFEPIPLGRSVEAHHAGLGFRFSPSGTSDSWQQDRLIDGQWVPFCQYDLRPLDPRDGAAAYQRHHTPGQSWVVDNLVIIRCLQDQVLVLRDREFTRFTPGSKVSQTIAEPKSRAQLVARAFGLPDLPAEAAIRALEARLAAGT